jgi:hypothetical protein
LSMVNVYNWIGVGWFGFLSSQMYTNYLSSTSDP